MAKIITKDHAEKIAAKLNAIIKTGGKHDLAKIYFKDQFVAQFGIQRGSKKDTSHSYISGQIYLSKNDCMLLAQCPLSRDEWVEKLIAKGIIKVDE